jgi:hypothetical protein
MARIANATNTAEDCEIKITSEMIEAGEWVVLRHLGGVKDLGGLFSPSELACEFYRAIERLRKPRRGEPGL